MSQNVQIEINTEGACADMLQEYASSIDSTVQNVLEYIACEAVRGFVSLYNVKLSDNDINSQVTTKIVPYPAAV